MWKDTERGKKYYKDYYLKNRDRIVETRKKYAKEHKDEHRKATIAYYYRNRDKFRIKLKERYKTSKYRFHALKGSAKSRGLIVEITLDDFTKITKLYCEYCGIENKGLGIDRIDSSIGYLKENCVSCCSTCNFMKRTLSKNEFLNHIEKIYKYNL